MADQRPLLSFTTVELTPDLNVRTQLPPSCHSALRAGFAGYTDNPRWTPIKRHGWKQGRQWRDQLAAQELEIRDGLLLTPETLATIAPAKALAKPSAIAPPDIAPEKGSLLQTLLNWSRKKPAIN